MTIVIPSEIQAREFDAKLLTACILAERGRVCIVGARHEIHNRIARLGAQVYLAKDLSAPSEKILGIMKGLGISIASLDEEAALTYSNATYYNRRTTPKAVKQIDIFCAWGPRSRRLTQNIPSMKDGPVVETGNPRIDMLRPELRKFHQRAVDDLISRFGKFILVNSNFGMVNPVSFSDKLRPEVMRAQHEDVVTRFNQRKAMFQKFQTMLPIMCAAFSDHRVIVRPHPAERVAAWENLLQSCPNLLVSAEGDVVPWLLAASAMVHNGCSTGFESFILGRQSISFLGVENNKDDALNSDFFSEIVMDKDALIAALQRCLNGEQPKFTQAQNDELRQHFTALDGTLAAERLADLLENIQSEGTRQLKAVYWAEKRGLKKRIQGFVPDHKNGPVRNSRRFPGVTRQDIDDKMSRLRLALGRFNQVKATSLGGNVYRIESIQK